MKQVCNAVTLGAEEEEGLPQWHVALRGTLCERLSLLISPSLSLSLMYPYICPSDNFERDSRPQESEAFRVERRAVRGKGRGGRRGGGRDGG